MNESVADVSRYHRLWLQGARRQRLIFDQNPQRLRCMCAPHVFLDNLRCEVHHAGSSGAGQSIAVYSVHLI